MLFVRTASHPSRLQKPGAAGGAGYFALGSGGFARSFSSSASPSASTSFGPKRGLDTHHSSSSSNSSRRRLHFSSVSVFLCRAQSSSSASSFSSDSLSTSSSSSSSEESKKKNMPGSTNTRVVLWFRNDLRLSDNYIVKQAEKMAARTQGCDVLPVYCFDPRTFALSASGSPKTGGHRAKFQRECVLNLKAGWGGCLRGYEIRGGGGGG